MAALGAAAAWAGPAAAQQPPTAVVYPSELQQRIDGFGASSAWVTTSMTASDANLTFSTDGGVGLSLLRIRIAPCMVAADNSCMETTAETSTAQTAQAMGVRVWATPWTPPAAWKSNDSTQDGGTLLAADEDDWANALVGFVQYMQSEGVNLVGVSAQNEPTQSADYESCTYTADSLADFIGNHMGPAFQDAGLLGDGGLPFGIIAPETVSGGSDFAGFSSQILASDAVDYVGTVATHSYGTPPPYDPAVGQAGKEYWETEVYDQGDLAAPDAGPEAGAAAELASGLWVATTMNSALVTGGVNAWHYWWLYNYYGNNEGLFNLPGQPTKRLYAMGNYSRFVRPGFYRVTATQLPADNVYVSAFYDPPSSTIVVVAANTSEAGDGGPGTVPMTFLFSGFSTGSWTSWVTSATLNLEPGDPIPTTGPVTYTLQPQSVTTLQGLVTGAAPVVAPDAGSSIAVVGVAGPDGGVVVSDSPGGNSQPIGGEGCGLACSAAGRTPKSGRPARLALGVSLAACTLACLRSRRRGARRRGGGPSRSGPTGRAAEHGVRERRACSEAAADVARLEEVQAVRVEVDG